MFIKFLGTGPTKEVEGEGRNRRTNSSIYAKTDKAEFVIDVTKDFLEQIKNNNIENIDFVLLTHAHADAISGLSDLDKWTKKKISVYSTTGVIENERLQKKFANLELKSIPAAKETEIEGVTITPFKVIHAEAFPTGPKFPAYGYKIDGITYAEDMESIPKDSERFFENSHTIIADGAMWFGSQIRGHMSVDKTIELAKQFNPKLLLITQAGHTYPPYNEAVQKINEYWEKNKGDCKTRVKLTYDGMLYSSWENYELMQGAFGSPGGKTKVAKKLLKLIPEHRIYCEPFAGGAAIFWRKEPSEVEVLNDKNQGISFAYKFIQKASKKQVDELMQMDWEPSKTMYFEIRDNLIPKSDIEKFYKFMYVNKYSYGISSNTYGWFPKERVKTILARFDEMQNRLKGVKIYCSDYSKVIEAFNTKDAFFFIDPPYPEEWKFKKDEPPFVKEDYEKLLSLCKQIKGKFLLTTNILPWIRDMFSDFKQKKILFPRTFQKIDKPDYELLIANYDIGTNVLCKNSEDGLDEILIEDDEEEMIEEKPGIYLTSPHARWIWMDRKKLIIKRREYPEMVDKALYLVDKEYCYGVIRLHPANKINKKQFEERKNLHLISDEEAAKWWGTTDTLFEYGYSWIDKFEVPQRWKYVKGIQTFVKNIEFLSEDMQVELIKDIKNYNPDNANNAQLADDWRIVMGWYSTYKTTDGKGIKFSLEDIINLAKVIYDEIVKRVKDGKMKHEFKPEDMEPSSKELYYKVSGKEPIISKEYSLDNLDFVKEFKDFTIIKDCISIVGSTVKKVPGHEANDIDLQIRLNEPENSYIRRAIEVRLLKMLEEAGQKQLLDKIHFIWGDSEGSHDDFCPLFDLKLTRVSPVEIVKMSRVSYENKTESIIPDVFLNSEVTPLKPYLPMKPHGSAYYKIDEILGKLEKGILYTIQYKANGFHCSIHKKGDELKIFSEHEKDITSAFPTLEESIKSLSPKSFVIDGELMYYQDGKPAGRRDLMKFIGAVRSGKKISDENVKAYIWDITYFDDKTIMDLPLIERVKILDELKFNDRVMKIPSKTAEGDELKPTIEWASKITGSEGAVIKRLDSPYMFDEKSSAWLKYRVLVDIDCVVLERIPKERGLYIYLVGIYLNDADKDIYEKHITTFNNRKVLVLGHTFNTLEKIEPGEIVSILIEEIWKHQTKDGIYYSIHKPRLSHVTNKKETSSTIDLDKIVDSVGFLVPEFENAEFSEFHNMAADAETTYPMVKNFPNRMQNAFRKIMDNKLWMPFVCQIHTIGHKAHSDFRLFIPDKIPEKKVLQYDEAKKEYKKGSLKGYCEGWTFFHPSTVDENRFIDSNAHDIQGTVKVPPPTSWLFFDGITWKVGTAGTHYPGVFISVAEGIYTILDVEDHKIVIQFKSDKGSVNLKPLENAKKIKKSPITNEPIEVPTIKNPPTSLIDINGVFSNHIAHIEPTKWIILFDKVRKQGRPDEVTSEQLRGVYDMTMKDASKYDISRNLNISKVTVYKCLRLLGLYSSC